MSHLKVKNIQICWNLVSCTKD